MNDDQLLNDCIQGFGGKIAVIESLQDPPDPIEPAPAPKRRIFREGDVVVLTRPVPLFGGVLPSGLELTLHGHCGAGWNAYHKGELRVSGLAEDRVRRPEG